MTAVLIDSLSIQQYIFASNKLREQIGASYIVEKRIFDECIPLALQQVFSLPETPKANAWESEPNTFLLEKETKAAFEIGYIGGGNALVLFREAQKANEFIKAHSLLLLQHFPGIKTAYAIDENFAYKGDAYKACRERLSKQLIQNRNFHTTLTVPFKPGIADDCDFSGEGKEDFKVREIQAAGQSKQVFASAVTYSKQNDDLIKEARKYLTDQLLSANEQAQYAFTDNQEELGQPDEKGYIAIVHADGNGMGQKFLDAASLAQTRTLSAGTKLFAKEVMKKLMHDVIDAVAAVDYLKVNEDDEGRRFLPIRPIIAGGDDITFVCEGRLGMYLAERLLHHMTSVPIDGSKIQACAGVVLVHSKFPFYKAYKLCEEVTKVAKDASRGTETSRLHYHLSTGGFSGSYEDIVRQEFTVTHKGSLKYGPYVVNSETDEKSIVQLRKRIEDFATKWPRSKAKELRDVLRRSEADEKYFITSLKVHKKAAEMNSTLEKTNNTLWQNGNTIYFDPIELLDFYPAELLNKTIKTA